MKPAFQIVGKMLILLFLVLHPVMSSMRIYGFSLALKII